MCRAVVLWHGGVLSLEIRRGGGRESTRPHKRSDGLCEICGKWRFLAMRGSGSPVFAGFRMERRSFLCTFEWVDAVESAWWRKSVVCGDVGGDVLLEGF